MTDSPSHAYAFANQPAFGPLLYRELEAAFVAGQAWEHERLAGEIYKAYADGKAAGFAAAREIAAQIIRDNAHIPHAVIADTIRELRPPQ